MRCTRKIFSPLSYFLLIFIKFSISLNLERNLKRNRWETVLGVGGFKKKKKHAVNRWFPPVFISLVRTRGHLLLSISR
jgi:hypothetical protein